MLCENCGKREANVRYSENINGVKKEMHLCEECSRKLGIAQDMDFKIPALDFSNFFGSFLEDFNTPDFMPLLNEVKQLKCDSCGSTFEDIIDTGKTLQCLVEHIKKQNPNSIKIATLLSKPSKRVYDLNVDYIGFKIEDKFVVGFGLDDNQNLRNLPYIGYYE